jgi:transposase
MQIKLHRLATTTPAPGARIWEEINCRKRTPESMTEEIGVSAQTVHKWSSVPEGETLDRSHRKHSLNILSTPKEESAVVFSRENIGLSLRDICIVLHKLFGKENRENGR